MDDIDGSNLSHNDIKQAVNERNINDPYSSDLAFVDIGETKEEIEVDDSSIQFQPSALGSTSPIKVEQSSIMNMGVPLVNPEVTISSSRNVLVNANDANKVLSNQTILPLGQGVNFNSSSLSLSNINSLSSGTTLVTTSQNNNIMNQTLPIYPSTSFENVGNVLESQHNTGQTFLLTSPNTVLSSNQMVTQGQVFIQGDELVGVSLPTSMANSYSVASSDNQYASTVPVIQSSNQNISASGSSTRLIIQPNQPSSSNISSPILSTNSGHYLIQVSNPLSNISSNSNFSINNKGHIVIKSGTSKVKPDQPNLSNPPKDGIFRVIIPEGTTKLPKPNYPIKVNNTGDEGIRKHVQINLSNRATYQPPKLPNFDTTSVQTQNATFIEKQTPQLNRKLYECTNCNSKFMKALYLRMHMRSCKKPETKPEKVPMYMCSYCKATFKMKTQINVHFIKCIKCPSDLKNVAEKRSNEDSEMNSSLPNKRGKFTDVDTVLEQAIQFKCQDCDRTFNKERQYMSHIKRCTKISVHDLSGVRSEPTVESLQDDDHESSDDPFADPPPSVSSSTPRRGRGGGGKRGRPPGRGSSAAQKAAKKSDILFEGESLQATSAGLIVADNENIVRSTTGLAHTVQLTLETAKLDGQYQPAALVTDSKGVRGREKVPQAWSLVCSLCQKMFLTKIALANHVIDSHGEDLKSTKDMLLWQYKDTKDMFRCPVCDLHYESSQHFLEHLVMQHTQKLQECHKNLQFQTSSFVCSLCSLVLLTKNLLLEHICLNHLEELEKIRASSLFQKNKKVTKNVTKSDDPNIVDFGESIDEDKKSNNESLFEDFKDEDNSNPLECRYCGEEFELQESLISHYIYVHGVDTDGDGNLLDLGMDVDIRVKDTKTLLQLADGKVNDSNLPSKTILIRKKPKQSWQCQHCKMTFTRQAAWLSHVRENCLNSSSTNDNSKSPVSQRECKFYCMEPKCSHLAFLQFKSLAKHKEEAHNIIVKRERKTFVNLSVFYQWLSSEEKKHNVCFIKDSTRLEKNNVRLIQMVCHKFQSSKADQNKEQNDLNKPTKKRWYVRVQRENNCYARIYIRVEYNEITKEFDGETQIIYYPEHCHDGTESELMEGTQQKYLNKKVDNKNNGDLDSGETNRSIDSPGDMFMEETERLVSETLGMSSASQILEYSSATTSGAANLPNNAINSVSLLPQETNLCTTQHSTMILPHSPLQGTPVTSNGLLVKNNNGEAQFVMPGDIIDDHKTALLVGEDANAFMVMERSGSEPPQEMSEEYILPADETEWTKLFDVLSTRISAGDLNEEEKKEAEDLLSYKDLVAMTSLSQQVDIFQRMCSLTNIEA